MKNSKNLNAFCDALGDLPGIKYEMRWLKRMQGDCVVITSNSFDGLLQVEILAMICDLDACRTLSNCTPCIYVLQPKKSSQTTSAI